MYDCCPTSDVMAHAAVTVADFEGAKLPGCTESWCGDVWKTVVFIRWQCSGLREFFLNTDCGMGIVAGANRRIHHHFL